MKNYQYLLFDWDGCLAKTLEIWLDTYEKVYGEYGVFPTREEIASHFNKTDNPKYFGITQIEECLDKVDHLAEQSFKKTELYDGAKALLQKLILKKKLALLSSSKREVLRWGIDYNHLDGIFSAVIGREDVTHHKPNPEVYEKGLAALDGTKEKAVIIGDSQGDLQAAASAGIDSILYYPPSHKLFYDLDYLKKSNPTFIVSDFQELEKLLLP